MDKLLYVPHLKNLLKYSDTLTDNLVFRIHYKFTTALLFGCSVLVTATQFFGDPILCVSQDVIANKIMNSYCWVEGTITLPRSLNATVGVEVAAPGVDQRRITENDDVIEHTYYQWVCFFLFFQGCMFYFPRWLWRLWEQGLVRRLTTSMKNPVLRKSDIHNEVCCVAEYIDNHEYQSNAYAYKFILCEILNLVNVIGQIYFVDAFLGYQFRDYGPSTLFFMTQDPEGRVDPMSRVFPKMTKCRLKRFGPSGEVQNHDAICVLSLNILNEKIFVCLWFWFVILATVTAMTLVYRLFIMRAPSYRHKMLHTLAKVVDKDDMKVVVERCNYGGWFVLSLIKDNVKARHFAHIVHELAECLRKKNGHHRRVSDGDDSSTGSQAPLRETV